jgi:hypothetical protein
VSGCGYTAVALHLEGHHDPDAVPDAVPVPIAGVSPYHTLTPPRAPPPPPGRRRASDSESAPANLNVSTPGSTLCPWWGTWLDQARLVVGGGGGGAGQLSS